MKHEAWFGAIAVLFIIVALTGCSTVQPYTEAVTSSGAYQATAEFVGKYHEGTPCSSFRYNDAGCD